MWGGVLTLEAAAPSLHRQYFDLPELPHVDNEIFIDCGCLDGGTSKNFINWCKGEYQHIYAFEPDENQLKNCRAALAREKADIFSYGVWSEKTKLHFSTASPGDSYVSVTGESVIEVDSLDNLLGDVKATFIKMDIEGSEMEALRGAKNIIQANRPKLAICVYHKPADIYEIPELLLSYYEGYVFYLRHYYFREYESVLYAVPAEI